MKTKNDGDLLFINLDADELRHAILGYAWDRLPDAATVVPPSGRSLRDAEIAVGGRPAETCGVLIIADRRGATRADLAAPLFTLPGEPTITVDAHLAGPVTSESLARRHVRALLRADQITLDEAADAIGLRTPRSRRAARDRAVVLWNDLARARRICTLSQEVDGGHARAVVTVHEDPPREVHGTPWYSDSESGRAQAWADATHWARRNSLVITSDDPVSGDGY